MLCVLRCIYSAISCEPIQCKSPCNKWKKLPGSELLSCIQFAPEKCPSSDAQLEVFKQGELWKLERNVRFLFFSLKKQSYICTMLCLILRPQIYLEAFFPPVPELKTGCSYLLCSCCDTLSTRLNSYDPG
ncbi:Hypothetical predicted protein [Podarcis lilfordi]|uniref:Uncharacterized protein n=1 Tax=Podarcis lilfordi TaxID=74358 RepID=A0AA35JWU6_9SAUR|nr:Hypothetical predicted protein [Podarcis lilfordi]